MSDPNRSLKKDNFSWLRLEACLGTYQDTDISYLQLLRRSRCLNKAAASQAHFKWHWLPRSPGDHWARSGPKITFFTHGLWGHLRLINCHNIRGNVWTWCFVPKGSCSYNDIILLGLEPGESDSQLSVLGSVTSGHGWVSPSSHLTPSHAILSHFCAVYFFHMSKPVCWALTLCKALCHMFEGRREAQGWMSPFCLQIV